jgi:hypothetical protein
VLKPLKSATKRLEERGKSGRFGAIAEIIPVFEYILSYYEQRVKAYKAVNYNAHDEAPENYLAVNLCAAWAKANEYYTKLDDSPAYYAPTILHPYYKTYCNTGWSDKSDWLFTNNRNFCALWAPYNASPRTVKCPKVLSSNMDDAIDGLIDSSTSTNNTTEEDEYKRWKRSEPCAEKGSDHANNPIRYWVELRNCYPNLSKLALNVLSI